MVDCIVLAHGWITFNIWFVCTKYSGRRHCQNVCMCAAVVAAVAAAAAAAFIAMTTAAAMNLTLASTPFTQEQIK